MKFSERLESLGFSDYQSYLKSSHWYVTRQKILTARKNCESCGSGLHLNVHHITYKRLGQELPEDLALICEACHNEIHDIEGSDGVDIAMATRFIKQKHANKDIKLTILPPVKAGNSQKINNKKESWWQKKAKHCFDLARKERLKKEKNLEADMLRYKIRQKRLSSG